MSSSVITSIHNTPHLRYATFQFSFTYIYFLHLFTSPSLKLENGDFGITNDSQWNEYTISTFVLPIIIAIFGLCSLFIFQCCLLWRYICFCKCPCVPAEYANRSSSASTVQAWMKSVIKARRKFIALYYCSILIILLSSCAVVSSYFSFESGLELLFDALDFLQSIFSTLSLEGSGRLINCTVAANPHQSPIVSLTCVSLCLFSTFYLSRLNQ